MRVLVMWCGMLVVTTARALTPNDFAEGFEVTPVGDAALQRVYLPGAVFRGATRTDLGDLRVFDRSGREVAFVLSVAAAPRTPAAWRAIQFFPLPDAFSPASPTSRVDVQVGAGGAIIAIRGGASHLAPVPGWLLDMSALHAPRSHRWCAPATGQFHEPGSAHPRRTQHRHRRARRAKPIHLPGSHLLPHQEQPRHAQVRSSARTPRQMLARSARQ